MLSYFVRRRMVYGEEQFLREEYRNADFGIVWDPTVEASARLRDVLSKNGIVATSLPAVAGLKEVEAFVNARAALLTEKKLDGAPWTSDAVEAFNRPNALLAPMLTASRLDYVFEFVFPQLNGATPIGYDPRLLSFVCVRLLDVSSNKTIMSAKAMAMQTLRLGDKDIKRYVEDNDLFRLKDFVRHTVDAVPQMNIVGLDESIVQISAV